MAYTTGTIPVGSSIKLHHNGTFRNFRVVHQGKPSQIYDDSCIGTWLLMQDVYESRQWHSTNINDYENSNMHAYLNNEFFILFSEDVRSAIKQVKIPYRPGTGGSGIKDGASGLSARVFLLAGYEVGFTRADAEYMLADGAKLDYFLLGVGGEPNPKRAAALNGSNVSWWLRTPFPNDSTNVWTVFINGSFNGSGGAGSMGVRPAVILPSTLKLSEVPEENSTYTINWNSPPTTPTGISVPERVQINKSISVTWGGSTDADGDPLTYELERSVDAAAYTKINTGAALQHTDTAGANWTTVQYRVRATDGKDAYSDYAISPIRAVIHNVDPIITGTDTDLGTVTEPPSYDYQVNDTDSGDLLTVTEQLDSATLRTIPNAERNKQYACTLSTGQYVSLRVGQHRMSIIVADDKGNSAARNITFSREVNNIRFETHAAPADAMPEKVLISLRCSADPDAVSIKACNNYLDASPTWEPASDRQKHLFSNTEKTADHWMVGVQVSITKLPGLEEIVCFALSGAYL